MMFTHKNLMTVCCAAVLAFGLAACGSSGDDDNVAVTAPMIDGDGDAMNGDGDTKTPDTCDAGPSQACVDARQAELEAIEADDDATVGALNAAQMALVAAQTALSDANTADAEDMTVSGLIADATTATADITDESTPAEVAVGRAAIDAAKESLGGMKNLSDDATAALQGRIDALESSFSPNEMAVGTIAKTAAAATKRTKIADEAAQAQADDASLGGAGTPDTTDVQELGQYNLDIKHGETSITVEGATPDDDVKFTQARDFGDGRTMHTRKMVADAEGNVVEEVVIVSTDIEAPKATAFGTVHMLDVRADGEDATMAMPADALNIGIGDDALANVKASAFMAPAGTVGPTVLSFQQAVADDVQTMDVDEAMAAAEIMGTFNGAMGTYKCAADDAACSVTVNTMGVVSGVSTADDWVFIPSDGVTVDVADTDYLHYGFWLKRTTDADGMDTYDEVQTFAGATGIPATGSVTAVTGSATYKGGSTGVYVKDVYKVEGGIDTATSGHFMADVSLKAYFGQVVAEGCSPPNCGTITPTLLNSLSGTIDNFDLSGDEYNEWSVNLQGDINDNGTVTSAAGATGGGAPGSWSATFHGDVMEVEDVVPLPSSVVGEFNANFSNGSVAGGFGARKQ